MRVEVFLYAKRKKKKKKKEHTHIRNGKSALKKGEKTLIKKAYVYKVMLQASSLVS